MHSLTDTSGGVSDTAIYLQQAGLTGNVPFDGISDELAPVLLDGAESPRFFMKGSSGGPVNLQYSPEISLRPIEDEEGEYEVVVKNPPKKKTNRKHGLSKLSHRGRNSKSTITGPQPTPHIEVEKKYRMALNAAMEHLRVHVPAVHSSSFTGYRKPSKAIVLLAAVDYIKQLEAEIKQLETENARENKKEGI